jgi:uncharacterized protein (TIGR00369 family)
MDTTTGELLGRLRYSQKLVGNPMLPALHGGAIGALMESTAIFELLLSAQTTVLPKTINITVEYLRSGRPVDTYAHAIVTKQGRRVANVRVHAWQAERERPIAFAHAHFLILPDAARTTPGADRPESRPAAEPDASGPESKPAAEPDA